MMNKIDKFYVLVYIGDSADEEMFHIRGIGDKEFLKKQLSKPPTEKELVDEEGLYYKGEMWDEEIICGEDIMYRLPKEDFDYIVEIYHKYRTYYCFKNDEREKFYNNIIDPINF